MYCVRWYLRKLFGIVLKVFFRRAFIAVLITRLNLRSNVIFSFIRQYDVVTSFYFFGVTVPIILTGCSVANDVQVLPIVVLAK
jgi:hypothetical protein